jgi:hypothetical protein
MRTAALLIALIAAPVFAQEVKLPANLQKLASKAEESVDVTLDGALLKLTAQFLNNNDKDEAKAKKALAGLESITVRSYKFANEGDYNPADLDAIRDQLRTPLWSKVVGVKSKEGNNADVYLKVNADLTLGGVVIIAAEPTEMTFVSITGRLDLAQLADLGGRYHIPSLDVEMLGRHSKGEK